MKEDIPIDFKLKHFADRISAIKCIHKSEALELYIIDDRYLVYNIPNKKIGGH